MPPLTSYAGSPVAQTDCDETHPFFSASLCDFIVVAGYDTAASEVNAAEFPPNACTTPVLPMKSTPGTSPFVYTFRYRLLAGQAVRGSCATVSSAAPGWKIAPRR